MLTIALHEYFKTSAFTRDGDDDSIFKIYTFSILCSRIQVKGFFHGHEHSGRNVLRKYRWVMCVDLGNHIAFAVSTHECCTSLTAYEILALVESFTVFHLEVIGQLIRYII